MNAQTARKTLVAACMALAITLGVASLLLFIHANSSHTFAAHKQGLSIYLPSREHPLFIELQLGAYIVFFIGFLLNSRWGVFTDPLDKLVRKQRNKIVESSEEQ